ncbi:MAG TPA: nuclear transport factor 2 family protein [Azospirillum sp.]|nr:nuclear transport factor 2 family protein [Azospirillum sp.]
MEAVCDVNALIDAHIAAYNRHDVAAFMATLDPEAEIYEHPGKLQLRGHDQVRSHYTGLFTKLPELTVEVKRRTRLETHIVDEESLVLSGKEIARDVAVYRVENCLISRVDTID